MTTVLALSREQVRRLTGLSRRQLSYWGKTGFFKPAYGAGPEGGQYSRIYSFKDAVGLRTLAIMRRDHRIPLQYLRTVGQYLHELYEEPWAELTFYIVGRRVFFTAPEARAVADQHGQTVFEFALRKVEREVEAEIARSRQRTERDIGKIKRTHQVAESKAVLSGTRTPTSAIWDFHSAGLPPEEINAEYPGLVEGDITAAINYEKRQRRKKSA